MPTDDNNTDDGIDGAVCQNIIVSVHYSLYLAFPSGEGGCRQVDPFILPSPLRKVAADRLTTLSCLPLWGRWLRSRRMRCIYKKSTPAHKGRKCLLSWYHLNSSKSQGFQAHLHNAVSASQPTVFSARKLQSYLLCRTPGRLSA